MRFFLLAFFVIPPLSQALEVKAQADKERVALNESFVFTISVRSTGEKLENLDLPDLSNLNDFYLLEQWSGHKSSISIINGRMKKTSAVLKNYRFQPKTAGTLRIESLTVRAGGRAFTTDPVFITVYKGKTSAPPPSPPKKPPLPLFPDPFQIPNSLFDILTREPLPDRQMRESSIKLRTSLNKYSVYKSEMIQANLLLLQSSGSIRYQIYKTPKFKGFWKETRPNAPLNSFAGTQVIDQILYRKTLLDSVWLFPLQSGQLTVDSYSVRTDYSFGFHSQEKIYSSPARVITVRELPLQGRDHSFTGAVGSFAVQAEMRETEAEAHQPLSYKIIFKGSGHPRFISLPQLNFPDSAHIYPPMEKSQFSDLGKGTKEFEFLIVPKKEGILNIPSWTLSSFDPLKKRYIFHKIPSFSLSVKKGSASHKTEGEAFFEEKGRDQKRALFPAGFELAAYWPRFINYKNFMTFCLALFVFFPLSLAVLYIKNIAFKKELSLKYKIHKKIEAIQKFLDQGDWRKACAQMILAHGFALDSAQMKEASSGWRESLKRLSPSLNKKYAQRFESLLTQLESLSFSRKVYWGKEALSQSRDLLKQTKALLDSFLSDL